jgi:RNA recognition motif. (a.k.a. RRM, RBD, or RNP domain)
VEVEHVIRGYELFYSYGYIQLRVHDEFINNITVLGFFCSIRLIYCYIHVNSSGDSKIPTHFGTIKTKHFRSSMLRALLRPRCQCGIVPKQVQYTPFRRLATIYFLGDSKLSAMPAVNRRMYVPFVWMAASAASAWINPALGLSSIVPSTMRNHPHNSLQSLTTVRFASEKPYLPPDYTIDDEDDDHPSPSESASTEDENDIIPTTRSRRRSDASPMPSVPAAQVSKPRIPSRILNAVGDEMDFPDSDDEDIPPPVPSKKTGKNLHNQHVVSSQSGKKKEQSEPLSWTDSGTSWMERNAQFLQKTTAVSPPAIPDSRNVVTSSTKRASIRPEASSSALSRTSRIDAPTNDDDSKSADEASVRTFREDFRGTRVFVQNIPENCSWQTLKDHFRVAGNVVFASVSAGVDSATGKPKGHGIVQFETTAETQNAIKIMRDHPLEGIALFVREDIQEDNRGKQLRPLSDDESSSVPKGPTPPSKWKCADPEMAAQHLDEEQIRIVQQILKARNQARRRRNYEACDAMREELKEQYSVHLDDRLTMWWVGAAPPDLVEEVQSAGRWTRGAPATSEWQQIPSTPENDACIDPDLIMGLLKQRDIARKEKDFATADTLFEKARTAPAEAHLSLRIHDASRTWRVWSEDMPRKSVRHDIERNPFPVESPPAEQCIAICLEHAPEKVDEIRKLLENFPGREYNILKKLKQRYLNQ